MLTKSKQKRKLGDPQCFARRFEIAVDLPPQACLDRLKGLEQSEHGFLIPASRDVRIHETDDAYDFEIRLKFRSNSSLNSMLAKCSGVMFSDSWSGKTTIRGRFTAGMFPPIFVIFLSIFSFTLLISAAPNFVCDGVYAVVAMLFYGLIFHKQYVDFQTLIYKTFRQS
jgi:hypothetical protein